MWRPGRPTRGRTGTSPRPWRGRRCSWSSANRPRPRPPSKPPSPRPAGAGDQTAALARLADAKRALAAAASPAPAPAAPPVARRGGLLDGPLLADDDPAADDPAAPEPDPDANEAADPAAVAAAPSEPDPADPAPAPVAAADSAADGVKIVRVDPGIGPDPAETPAAPAADPASLPPADARDAGRAVRAAGDLPTAAAVVAALDRFAAARRLDDGAAEVLAAAREEFRPRAAAGEVRSGRDWVAPADRDARRRAAADAVAGGLAGLETGNLAAARELFEAASEADPDGILGDLWLGAGYTLGGALWDASRARGQAIAGAKDHFEEVLRRRPDHVGALNNLALAEWKLNDVRAAVRAWTEAAEIAPASRQLVQNVGRANRLAGSGVVPVGRRESRELAELYVTLSAAATGARFDDGTGWLVMPPVDPRAVEASGPEPLPSGPARGGDPADGGAVTVASGTGFCVAPGYVLTNRHVAVPGEELAGAGGPLRRYDRLAVAGADGAERTAELVAVSSDRDLALLRCDGLDAVPIPLAVGPPRLAADVLALGYPRPGVLGGGLKTTRGVITGLPAGQADGMLLFDAAVNPGNSGGPVCGRDGAAAAIATKIFLIDQGLSAGVTAADARRFLSAALPVRVGLPDPSAGSPGEWADVAEAVGPGVVRVLCGLRPDRLDRGLAAAGNDGPAGGGGTGPASGWEDRTCPVCLGGNEVRCGRDGCRRGAVNEARRVVTGYNRLTESPIYATKNYKVKCPTCDGSGTVRCPHCRVRIPGVDPGL